MSFLTDWVEGQQDCRNGVPHIDGKGERYDLGYAEEYEKQQAEDSKTCQLR